MLGNTEKCSDDSLSLSETQRRVLIQLSRFSKLTAKISPPYLHDDVTGRSGRSPHKIICS